MKRGIRIFVLILVIANLSATLHFFRKYDFNQDLNFLLDAYCQVSIYALKLGVLGVIVDWFSKDWFDKKDK
ncbi:hypothetical protein EDC44_12824 [Cricetibacter osteomyelitidis]|uniref:Uncharacterized protein n=1 Tax=Cricetibacter osteomyelitidis TaxID=1521931 RepID=A0A4R2STM4_9PAST|nr:hypothetical protein [Cricetibacter osteomyelitidis]TCP92071.1 hypothetical protein EDC44_12824 [Cricetibacter osteomyelitidis]